MRKLKKILAAVLTAAFLLGMLTVSAAADVPAGSVYISIADNGIRKEDELEQISADYRAPLGTIIARTEVEYYEGETIADVTLRLIENEGMTAEYTGSAIDSFYLSKIYGFYNSTAGKNVTDANSFGEFSAGADSGWMITLNDWFINMGASAFRVSNGDIIEWQFTCQRGADIGGSWNNADTTLKSLAATGGKLSAVRASEASGIAGEFDLAISQSTANVRLTPSANNKNYLVKAFLNQKVTTADEADGVFYKRTEEIPVKAGDKIYIGIGIAGWPSMNNQETEAVEYSGSWYVVNVYMLGDVSGDGTINNYDATLLRKHNAKTITLTAEQLFRADTSKDDNINNYDATLLRKYIAKSISSF